MASSLSTVQNDISNKIKKFKFDELEKFVMPVFPEITWSRLRWNLANNHYSFTVNNAVRIIKATIKEKKITLSNLKERLQILTIKDISRHNNKRIWYTYKLLNQYGKGFLGMQNLENNIIDFYSEINLKVDVKVAIHENITFVSVTQKDKGNKKKIISRPVFYALLPGQNYFFCSRKEISHNFIKVIAKVIGYQEVETIKLVGKNLNSLIRLLRYKEQNTLYAVNIEQPVYKASDPIVTNDGIDYTQTKQRINYMKQCFGEEPPILESLVINGPEESIKDQQIAAALPNDSTLQINWEFHSRNIANFLNNLVAKRILTLPLPDYIANLMTLGENKLKLTAH